MISPKNKAVQTNHLAQLWWDWVTGISIRPVVGSNAGDPWQLYVWPNNQGNRLWANVVANTFFVPNGISWAHLLTRQLKVPMLGPSPVTLYGWLLGPMFAPQLFQIFHLGENLQNLQIFGLNLQNSWQIQSRGGGVLAENFQNSQIFGLKFAESPDIWLEFVEFLSQGIQNVCGGGIVLLKDNIWRLIKITICIFDITVWKLSPSTDHMAGAPISF